MSHKQKVFNGLLVKTKGKNLPCDNCGKSIYVFPCLLKEYKYHFCNVKCHDEFQKDRPSGRKGEKFSKTHKENLSNAHKGYIMPQEQKDKIGKAISGQTRLPITDKHRQNLIKSHIGYIMPISQKIAIGRANSGEKCHLWKGGITPENERIRHSMEMRLWREAVYERDNYTCQICKQKGGKLHPHHIWNFALFTYLRFNVDNGITLCKECHFELHERFMKNAA